jgi:ribosomal protein S27E
MMQCPNCQSQVTFRKELFREALCKECGSTLLVSATYGRVLVALAIIAAEALLWVGSVRKLFYPALGVEVGFFASLLLGFPVGVSDTHCNGANDPALHPATLGKSAGGHSHHSWTHSIA